MNPNLCEKSNINLRTTLSNKNYGQPIIIDKLFWVQFSVEKNRSGAAHRVGKLFRNKSPSTLK